jgi:hypothetical protein
MLHDTLLNIAELLAGLTILLPQIAHYVPGSIAQQTFAFSVKPTRRVVDRNAAIPRWHCQLQVLYI